MNQTNGKVADPAPPAHKTAIELASEIEEKRKQEHAVIAGSLATAFAHATGHDLRGTAYNATVLFPPGVTIGQIENVIKRDTKWNKAKGMAHTFLLAYKGYVVSVEISQSAYGMRQAVFRVTDSREHDREQERAQEQAGERVVIITITKQHGCWVIDSPHIRASDHVIPMNPTAPLRSFEALEEIARRAQDYRDYKYSPVIASDCMHHLLTIVGFVNIKLAHLGLVITGKQEA